MNKYRPISIIANNNSNKKLGIKFYINNKLKGSLKQTQEGPMQVYPLYVQLTYKGEVLRRRSETNILYKDVKISNFPSDLLEAMAYEESKIKLCFSYYIEKGFADNISEMTSYYLYDFASEAHEHVEASLKSAILNIIETLEASCDVNLDYLGIKNEIFLSVYVSSLFDVDNLYAIDVLELYKDKVPELDLLIKMYSSKIWFFRTYYHHFKNNVNSDIPMFKTSYPRYTMYELTNGLFQREFLDFYKHNDTAKDIVADIEKLFGA